MSSPNANDFGELRSLLQQTPSAHGWERLKELLARWPEPERQQSALPYVQDHLRRPPWSSLEAGLGVDWLTSLNRGELDGALLSLPARVDAAAVNMDVFQAQHWSRGEWSRVRHLNLRHAERPAAVLMALSQASWPALESLDLRACSLDDEALAALARWKMPKLKSLDIGFNAFGEAGLMALAGSSFWPSLESFSLGHTQMSAHMMQLLAQATQGALALKQLRIERWPFDWPTARALGDAVSLISRLESLAIYGAGLGADELGALFIGSYWPKLKALDLGHNRLGGVALRVLDRLDGLDQLERFGLSQNNINAEQLGQSRLLASMRQLRALELMRNPIGDRGVELLASMQSWSSLESLDVSGCQLSAVGASHIKRGPWCERLEHLSLNANPLGADGFNALFKGSFWPSLKRLELKVTQCDEACAWWLMRAVGQCAPQLQTLDLSLNSLGQVQSLKGISGLELLL